MFIFKNINNTSTVIEQNLVHYQQNFNTSSAGISSIKIVSGSTNNNYWQSLNVLFYSSGSPSYDDKERFSRPSSNFALNNRTKPQHLNKFHGYPNISVITISQQSYGEKIKPGSFELIDLENPDNNNNNPTIVDDGFGNLYSTNAHHSQSTSAASSSDNYVGNIFYDKGLAVITENSKWSGSVKYQDLTKVNYDLKFNSQHTITTYEYNVTLLSNEFNNTMNYTVRAPLSGSSESLSLSTSTLASEFTSSNFQPYITTINLYQKDDYDTPVIQATLPRAIRKSDKINTRFKIRLDL